MTRVDNVSTQEPYYLDYLDEEMPDLTLPEEVTSAHVQWYKYWQQKIADKPVQDTQSSFDSEEDLYRRKLRRFDHENPVTWEPVPSLAKPISIALSKPPAISEDILHLAKKDDPTKPADLDDKTPKVLNTDGKEETEWALERDVNHQQQALRALHQEAAFHNSQEMNIRMKAKQKLHNEIDELLQHIAERAKTSKTLDEVQTGLTYSLVALSGICFAVAIVTGGLSAILGAITSVAAAGNGVIGGTNGIMQLQTEEKKGHAQELTLLRTVEHDKIRNLLAANQVIMKSLHNQMSVQIESLRQLSHLISALRG